MNQFLNVGSNFDSIDTFESYTNKLFIIEKNLIFPVINLLLIDDIIGNPIEIKIELCYLIIKDVAGIAWIGSNKNEKEIIGKIELEQTKRSKTDWFAINRKYDGYELKVNFDDLEIFIPENSRFGKKRWIPWTTPNFDSNIPKKKSTEFFNLELLPENNDIIKSKKNKALFVLNNMSEDLEIDVRLNWSKE